MQMTIENMEGKTIIKLTGRFDFASHKDFRNACSEALLAGGNGEIEVDLGDVDYLDSSALGMLLLLREKARAAQRDVTLTNCRGTVQHILKVANLGKLFSIN